MKFSICVILALALVGNNTQLHGSIIPEEIATFYIDAIVLNNDPTPRKSIDVNTSIHTRLSDSNYLVVNGRDVIVFAEEEGYKAELISISGNVMHMKPIVNGKTDFNVKNPGVYLVKISSQSKKTTYLKTLVQ
jgi:hypothetical protein